MEVRPLYPEPQRSDDLSFGALEFHDVFKIYRSGPAETVALRGLDLRVERGELVALFGPSGSGKSTALHLAAGLEEASAGDVVVSGRSLARLGEVELAMYRAREVALVFQSGNLWPDLSAQENVVLGLRLAGRGNVRGAAERALDRLPLLNFDFSHYGHLDDLRTAPKLKIKHARLARVNADSRRKHREGQRNSPGRARLLGLHRKAP